LSSLSHTDWAIELTAARAAAQSWRPITFEEDFPGFDAAWAVCNDETRFQVWDCSRRAAKTGTASRRTVKRSSERKNHRTLYIHRTRNLAKMQFFETGEAVGSQANPGVMELLKRHGIEEAKHDGTELWVRLRNGALVQAVGCDDMKAVDSKLGFQWDDVLIDECQDHDDELLRRLVDKTLLPTMIDRGGTLTLMGTPPEVEDGLWWEVSTPGSGATFKIQHWTLLDNPFIDRNKLIEVYAERGLPINFDDPSKNSAVVQREIFGIHIIDPESLTYCYQSGPAFNDWPVMGIPGLDSDKWRYSIGIDIGGMDPGDDEDAIVVLGWRMDDPTRSIYERESWKDKADSHDFQEKVGEMFKRWQPMQGGCGDAGADKMLAYWKKRFGGLELAKKPSDLDVSQRLLNDEFRSRRLKLNPLGVVAKAAKTCRKGKHEADAMAACRYAFHGAYNWLAKAPADKNTPKTSQEIDDELDRKRQARWHRDNRMANSPWKNSGGWNQ